MVRIASYNVENLFARPKVLNTSDWSYGLPALKAFGEVNKLISRAKYTPSVKKKIIEALVKLDIYYFNSKGAIRSRRTQYPKWAWLRKNRGKFDKQPRDAAKSIEIIASGKADWNGWIELAKEHNDEISTQMTANVILEINADIIGIVEADDRPSLVQFNKEALANLYGHVMLIDGNDKRGIDVGIMMGDQFEIKSMLSNVDTTDATGIVFSRDCPQYQIRTPKGTEVNILVNHLKSQSGGGGVKRRRQAIQVRLIVDDLVAQGKHVVVLGDFNEGPKEDGKQAVNLEGLFDNDSPLVDCYGLNGFDLGGRPGTYDSCGLRNRLDYILISQGLVQSFKGGEIFRAGLWGVNRKSRPTDWDTYLDMTKSSEQASDHAAVYIDLDI